MEKEEIKIGSAIKVAILGILYLGLAFLFTYIFQRGLNGLLCDILYSMYEFYPKCEVFIVPWLIYLPLGIFIIIASWFILNKDLKTTTKATFMMVPIGVIDLVIGLMFNIYDFVTIGLFVFISLVIYYYLNKTKQSWIYYLSLVVVTILMIIMAIFNLFNYIP